MCVCSDIKQWIGGWTSNVSDIETRLETHLDAHLREIHSLLSQSKSLSRKLSFVLKPKRNAVTVRQERTAPIFRDKFDFSEQKKLFRDYHQEPRRFWHSVNDDSSSLVEDQVPLLQDFVFSTIKRYLWIDRSETYQVLVRRLSAVAVYLLSKAFSRYAPASIAKSFHNAGLFPELSEENLEAYIHGFGNSGKWNLDFAFELGGIGWLWWLPTEVPRTAWEKYLPRSGVERNRAITHLRSSEVAKLSRDCNESVKQLILYPIKAMINNIPSSIIDEIENISPARQETRSSFTQIPNPSTSSTDLASIRTLEPTSAQPEHTNSGFHYRSQQVYTRISIEISYDSPIFVCVQNGDIDGSRTLLASQTASIDSVDPYGLGLLYYATYYCWRNRGPIVAFRICRALLDLGANAQWPDEIGNTPMETLLDDILITRAMENRRQEISATISEVAVLFDYSLSDLWHDYEDSRGFSPLHKVLLGLDESYGTLEEYLSLAEATGMLNVDCTDSRGRSPLAWAVEYAWAAAAETLIKFGANVHQLRKSTNGISPLLHLAIAGPSPQQPRSRLLETIKILLREGADINSKDHELWTPLHIAASWSLHDVLMELVEFGGQALDWAALTTAGQSAIDLAIDGGADGSVLRLLQGLSLSPDPDSISTGHTRGEPSHYLLEYSPIEELPNPQNS